MQVRTFPFRSSAKLTTWKIRFWRLDGHTVANPLFTTLTSTTLFANHCKRWVTWDGMIENKSETYKRLLAENNLLCLPFSDGYSGKLRKLEHLFADTKDELGCSIRLLLLKEFSICCFWCCSEWALLTPFWSDEIEKIWFHKTCYLMWHHSIRLISSTKKPIETLQLRSKKILLRVFGKKKTVKIKRKKTRELRVNLCLNDCFHSQLASVSIK